MNDNQKLSTLLNEVLQEGFYQNGGVDFDVDEENQENDFNMSSSGCVLRASVTYGYPGYNPKVNFVFNATAISADSDRSFISSKLYFINDEKMSFSRINLKQGSIKHFQETLQFVTGRKVTLR